MSRTIEGNKSVNQIQKLIKFNVENVLFLNFFTNEFIRWTYVYIINNTTAHIVNVICVLGLEIMGPD